MKWLIFINVLISFQLNAQNWKLIALPNSPLLSLNTAENNEKIMLKLVGLRSSLMNNYIFLLGLPKYFLDYKDMLINYNLQVI